MYGWPVVLGVMKYWRNLRSVLSSLGTDDTAILPVMSTTPTDSYSAERAVAAFSASRAISFSAGSLVVA